MNLIAPEPFDYLITTLNICAGWAPAGSGDLQGKGRDHRDALGDAGTAFVQLKLVLLGTSFIAQKHPLRIRKPVK